MRRSPAVCQLLAHPHTHRSSHPPTHHSNPERFTGYAGPSARRVWTSIYENCFELTPEEMSAGDHCFEKRIFYRLIAGLQSSISTHLAL